MRRSWGTFSFKPPRQLHSPLSERCPNQFISITRTTITGSRLIASGTSLAILKQHWAFLSIWILACLFVLLQIQAKDTPLNSQSIHNYNFLQASKTGSCASWVISRSLLVAHAGPQQSPRDLPISHSVPGVGPSASHYPKHSPFRLLHSRARPPALSPGGKP